jgi:PhnB protein
MLLMNLYLNFNGNTEDAFNFYKSIFGGEFTAFVRFKNTPEADRVPENEKDKIMHVSLPIGQRNLLMGTDALESMGHPLSAGNNFTVHLDTESEKEVNRLFDKLSADGIIGMKTQIFF